MEALVGVILANQTITHKLFSVPNNFRQKGYYKHEFNHNPGIIDDRACDIFTGTGNALDWELND